MLAVKIVEKKRYMVQEFEKKKTVINVTSIQERFEERRTVFANIYVDISSHIFVHDRYA